MIDLGLAAPLRSLPTPPDPAWGWTVPWVAAWPLAIAITIAVVACVRSDRLRVARPDAIAIVGLFIGAAALRLWLGVWAPLHINGQGPLWIGAATGRASMLVGYGPGYPELYAAIVAMLPDAPDVAIFASNAVASACVPVLVFVLGRIAGLARDRAGLAALIFAVDPIAVRMSASESYFVPIVVLTLATSVGVAAAVREQAVWRRCAWVIAAAAFAVQAARIHPVGWIPLALCPLAAMLPPGISWRRLGWVAITGAAIGVAVAATSAGWIALLSAHATRYGEGMGHHGGRMWVLVPIVLAFVLARSTRWPLVVVATVALVADVLLRPVYGQSEVWQASFDRLLLAMPVLAVAATIPAALFGPRAQLVLAGGVVVVAVVRGFAIPTPTTEQVEYRWLRDQLAQLDAQCRVTSISRSGQRVHYLPWFAMDTDPPSAAPTPTRWIAVRDPGALAYAARHGDCVVWVHSSLCESEEARPLCTAIEQAVVLEELGSLQIAAIPSADPYPYDVDPVRISLHRVTAR